MHLLLNYLYLEKQIKDIGVNVKNLYIPHVLLIKALTSHMHLRHAGVLCDMKQGHCAGKRLLQVLPKTKL